jgi:hypothetical protein
MAKLKNQSVFTQMTYGSGENGGRLAKIDGVETFATFGSARI